MHIRTISGFWFQKASLNGILPDLADKPIVFCIIAESSQWYKHGNVRRSVKYAISICSNPSLGIYSSRQTASESWNWFIGFPHYLNSLRKIHHSRIWNSLELAINPQLKICYSVVTVYVLTTRLTVGGSLFSSVFLACWLDFPAVAFLAVAFPVVDFSAVHVLAPQSSRC